MNYTSVFSQTAIDSAANNMNVDSIHDSTKILKLGEVSREFAYENPDSTIKLLDIGLKDRIFKSNFEKDSIEKLRKNYYEFHFNNMKICYYLLNRK